MITRIVLGLIGLVALLQTIGYGIGLANLISASPAPPDFVIVGALALANVAALLLVACIVGGNALDELRRIRRAVERQ